MRKEYDFSNGERGKFYGKADTKNPLIETENETLDEIFEDELAISSKVSPASKIYNRVFPNLTNQAAKKSPTASPTPARL